MSADESKPPSQAAGEIAAKPEAKVEPAAPPVAEKAKDASTWVKEDPFPPRREPSAKPAAAAPEKVVVDPSLRPAPAAEAPRSPAPSARPEPPRPQPSRTTTASSEPARDRDPAEPRRPGGPLAGDELLPHGRRWLGLPIWGWLLAAVAVLGLLFLMADLRNRNRFTIICNAHKVELQQGRRFPWPFGNEPLGGQEYAPVAIPAEADCRKRSFGSEEEAARAFLDVILGQVRSALANPGASNLKQARAQLAQAMLLTRTYRARRKKAQGMLADLSYREGRASLARAENELRVALARFQEAQKLEGGRFEDLDDWISHLESLLRTISPSPFSGGGGLSPSLPAGAGPGPRRLPSSQPTRPPSLAPVGDGGLPSLPSDAGPPGAGGGILM